MKKLFSILSLLVLAIASSVLLVACGDDYKNMYLEVEYVLWSNNDSEGSSGQWTKVDAGKGLDFVLNENSKKTDEGGKSYYSLRIRVNVKGTKKDVDYIAVSCTGSPSLQLEKKTVSSGEAFEIKVWTTGSANLSFTPSVKSDKKAVTFPINLYAELGGIAQNGEYAPAVVKGGTLELNKLTDLIVYSGKDGMITNQLGVVYSMSETDGVTLETDNSLNRLTVSKDFKGDSINLTATSVYFEDISCNVEIKVVDNIDQSSFLINYASNWTGSSENDKQNKLTQMELYPNLSTYNSSNIVLSGLFGNSAYNFDSEEIEIRVFVDGKDVTESVGSYNGLTISKVSSSATRQQWIVSSETYLKTDSNAVQFVVGFKNYKFTGTKDYNIDTSVLRYSVEVKRQELPRFIRINEEAYVDKNSLSMNIYNKYENNSGLQLTINTGTKTNSATKVVMKAYTNIADKTYDESKTALNVYSHNGTLLGPAGAGVVLNNVSNTIYLKYGDGSCPEIVYVDFEVLATPAYFEGKETKESEHQYIAVTMTLNTIGKIDQVSSSSNQNANYNNLFDDKNLTQTMQAGKSIEMYIKLSNSQGTTVSYTGTKIASNNDDILLSSDNINFKKEIDCGTLVNKKLYIKGATNKTGQLTITTPLGMKVTSRKISFASVTTVANPTFSVKTNNSNVVSLGSVENYDELNNQANFYAMQFNSSADFVVAYGDSANNYAGISKLRVESLSSKSGISQYGADVFKATMLNSYSFNLQAMTANLTSAIKVTITYNTGSNYSIKEETKVLYLEIASFIPVSNIQLVVSNPEVYYVNSLITDKATSEIRLDFNSNASTYLSFSDKDIEKSVNSNSNSKITSPYYVTVSNENAGAQMGIESLYLYNGAYLDMESKTYGFRLTKSLENINTINVVFTLNYYELGISRSVTATIRVVDFKKSTGIELRGLNQNNNINLSLQSDAKRLGEFTAYVSNLDASYKLLDYQLYELDQDNVDRGYLGDRIISNSVLSVEYSNQQFKLKAVGETGGKFILRIVAVDSYSDTQKDYTLCEYVVVSISDGEVANPFYLYNSDDVKNISNAMNKHYVLANNIDLSDFDKSIEGEFTGSLNGIMTSYDASNGVTVMYTQSLLKNLNINNTNLLSLFKMNKGTLKNIVMSNVKFNININAGASNEDINIGALVGENAGTIINCSAIINIEGTIKINRANETTSANSYNIGALVGKNSGNVYYFDQDHSELKQYSNYRQMAEFNQKLTVTLETVGSKTTINVGGAIGDNTGMVVGNYSDFNQDETEYLTCYTDIDFVANSTITQTYTANIGGFAGQNGGTIKNVAIKGSVTGAGNNINMGGIAGNNTSVTTIGENGEQGGIINSATFSCEIIGRPYSNGETVQAEITNQNVGGAVGLNSGSLTTVYVLFVQNSKNSNKFGLVKGVDTVGGLVGRMTAGQIVVGNVQGFVDDSCVVGNFASNNAINNVHKSVAGLVGYADGGTIAKSYAKVNISTDSGNVATLANGTMEIENSFFAGDIKDAGTLANLSINSNDSTYSLVKGYVLGDETFGKLLYNGEVKAYYYYDKTQQKELWTTSEPTIVDGKINLVDPMENADFAIPDWAENNNWTNDYKQYNSGLPVILYNGEPTLLALAESLVANVADDYFKTGKETTEDETKVYTHNNGIFFTNGTTSTAIVFLNHKTFNLVKKNADGLVDISVLPNIASKSYYVEIISGGDIISLVGNFITFKKSGRLELEFVSTFNPNAKDRVVIFAVEPIDNFVLVGGDKIDMTSNSSRLISLTAKYGDTASQLLNNYLYLGYENEEDSPITVTPLGDDFELNEKTYYAMDDIQLEVEDFVGNGKEYKITIDCYLDLSKFVYTLGVDQKTLMDLFNYQYKIASQTLTVVLYQRASSIVSNLTDTKVATSQSVDIEVEVTTGYVDKDDTEQSIDQNQMEINGQYLTTLLQNKENLQIKLSTTQDLSGYNLSSIWDMLNISAIYNLNSNKTGYVFNFNIELKDEYKDIVEEKIFVFEFAPTSNTILTKDVKITFEPQSITTLRVENFKSGVATLTGENNVQVEYTSSETQSSIIVPGKSGLAKIYVEPTFARVDELVISSTSVTIDGQTYTIYFQQMLYDQKKECYVSYQGYTSGSNSLRLVKNSYIDTKGETHYTGVVYVRTILENAVALDETFTLTVVATEYVRDENGTMTTEIKTQKTATKMLVTQFNPGVYVSSNGIETKADGNDVYLIEKSSNSYKITARIVGYKSNQNPELKLSWKDTRSEDITDYVSYSQSVIAEQSNGDYLVTWSLTTRNLIAPIVAEIKISVINEDMLTDTITKEITLYPVDYIPTQVALSGTANDVFRVGINSSRSLDIVWKNSDGELDSDQINASLKNYISFFYRITYNEFGRETYESWETKTYKNSEETSDTYKLSTSDKKLYVTGLGEDYVTIVFGVKYWFAYNNGKFEIKFVTLNDSSASGTTLQYTFKLDLRVETTEEEPEPIYTVADLRQMSENGNYILMNDLKLTDWVPLTVQIASLDGNSKRIYIESFNVTTGSDISAGLFASLGENCIIKNLTIDLREFGGNMDADGNYIVNLADENANTQNTYFGFIAGQNAGLIYNSELINTAENEKKLNIKTNSTYSYIGGLVGQNTGNITNSRVGTPYYLSLSVDASGNVSKKALETTNIISLCSDGIVGGLVATNSGIISSSYFQNTNLVNTSTGMDDTNKTAGFVAVNTGKIYNSYTKSKGRTSTQVRGQDTKISSKGTAAGFVFENSGIIENSYSNIYVTSSASAVAGFVYRNSSGASINRCYSASAVSSNVDKTTGATATNLAFVGVGIEGTELNKLLSFGELNNCYYLEIDGDNFDYNYETGTDMDVPIPLDDTNFADSENLNNFAFVNGNYDRATQGVWTYYANLDSNDTTSSLGKTFLPELTSANQISRSIRYLVSKDNERHQFAYGKDYALGTTNNPYIIRNYIEYNNIFSIKTSADENVIAGSIRLINDIDFDKGDGTTETVNTTQGYDLGDVKNSTITVFDGNGMTISNVDIKNYEQAELESLGLFGNIYNAVVKSLNVSYVEMDYSSTKAIYSGGLAGTINNSSIVDVAITGNNTTITAQNFAGGIAGYVLGDSILYNVSADINVTAVKKAQSTSNQYVSKDRFVKMITLGSDYDNYLKTLSYAGGIAGVIDVNEYKNFTNINQLVVGENSGVQVTADIAGFVAGYLGPQVTAKRLKAFVGAESYVFGAYIAGGLIGENYANISYSQVSAATSEQETVDSVFASYILADKTTPTSTPISNNSDYGNLSFVRSQTDANNTNNMAGGFVGVNYNGTIQNSYSKTSISADASYVGGFVGTTFGGGYETCYSQTYFDIQDKDKQQYIGGMIGYNKVSGDDMLSKYSLASNPICKVDNFVAISWFDKSQLEVEYNATDKKTIDYMVGHSEKGISSTKNDNAKSIYTYYLSYSNLSSESYFNKVLDIQAGDNYLSTESRDISVLFDLTHEKQLETFENLFMNFDDDIWKKDNKKFTPTLRDNPDLNFYQIKSESDLELIRQHPNGNFEVVGDITLSKDYKDYVLEIEFTGTMRGKLDSQGRLPTISGIKIISTDDPTRPGAGFFKATTGANISNIDFNYTSVNLTHNKTYVGLLSSDEVNSEVTGVNISFDEGGQLSGSSVQQFGGLFGDSESTICTSCSVDLSNCDFEIKGSGTDQKSAFGGLTGYAKGESTLNVNSMFMNCTFTKSNGNINVTGFEYVGGLAGYAENSNINTSTAKLLIESTSNSNKYVGGAVGYQHNAYLSALNIYANIGNAYGDTRIGGIVGYLKNDSKEKSCDISNSSARVMVTQNSSGSAYVGGIAGEVSSVAKIENVVAYISGSVTADSTYFGGLVGQIGSGTDLLAIDTAYAYAEGKDSNTGFAINGNNIVAGGLIGNIKSDCALAIDMAVVNGAVWAEGNSGQLFLGGLIGAWGEGKVNLQQAIDIATSNSTIQSHISNVYTTFALEYSQYELNSGTSLTTSLENKFAVSGIIGKLPTSSGKLNVEGKLSVSNVVYSSDYVLAVEEKDIFAGTIVNATAEVLLREDSQDEYFGDTWTKAKGQLPYITSLGDLMKNVDVLGKFTTTGSQMKPEIIQESKTFADNGAYTYYLIDNVSNVKSSYVDSTTNTATCDTINLTGSLKGFVLGSGKTIATTDANLTIGESSVVSNLNVQLNENKLTNSTGSGVIATTNKGTIFNCQVDFYFNIDKDNSSNAFGGGIVGSNQGNILYCYSTGSIENAGTIDFSGIAKENTGFIYSSGAVGILTGNTSSNSAGLVSSNTGTIYNCFSAVTVSTSKQKDKPISLFNENNGYIKNCYYDMYANNEDVEMKDGDNKILAKALSTYELQTSYSSNLLGNWTNYPMCSIQKVSTDEGSDTPTDTKTDEGSKTPTYTQNTLNYFNYGYPIYVIEQTWYDSDSKDKLKIDSKKGIWTGNGTEANPYLIVNAGTLESINMFTDTSGIYFELICDITFDSQNGVGIMKNWIGIGQGSGSGNRFQNASTGNFAGHFAGGERFKADWIRSSASSEENLTTDETLMRTITNLNVNSLFNTILGADIQGIEFVGTDEKAKVTTGGMLASSIEGEATIGNINFKGQFNLTNSSNNGLVAGVLNSTANIVNITMEEEIVCSSTGSFGGLIGEIEGNLIAINIQIKEGQYAFKEDGKSLSGVPATTGGLVGKLTSGSVTLSNSTLENMQIVGKENVGGLIGEMKTGNVTISSSKIGAEFGTTNAGKMGGFVGTMEGGSITIKETTSTATISNESATSSQFQFEFGANLAEKDRVATYAGGLVGLMNNGTINGNGATIDVKQIRANTSTGYAGGVVGYMKTGTVVSVSPNIGEDGTDVNYATCFGGIVGYIESGNIGCTMDGTQTASETDSTGVVAMEVAMGDSFYVNSAKQIGGIAGVADSGTFGNIVLDITNLTAKKSETLGTTSGSSDSTGLGGLIGVVNGGITLGNLEVTSMNIESDGVLSNVGGLFGLLKTNSFAELEDAEISISGLKVVGVNNVGGFVGKYNNEATIVLGNQLSKLLGQEEDDKGKATGSTDSKSFADVCLPTDKTTIKPSNFGGLFGYFCSGTLGYTLTEDASASTSKGDSGNEDDDQEDILPFVNRNSVLASESANWKGVEISYVGGIAGLTQSVNILGENEGSVGHLDVSEPSSTKESEIDKTLYLQYVGGIVGKFEPKDNSDDNLTFKNIKNTGKIAGYDMVGGIMGSFSYDKLTHEFEGENEIGGEIVGISNVGGYFGQLSASVKIEGRQENTETKIKAVTIKSTARVSGRINVGGLVGQVQGETISIARVSMETDSIMGLVNVGGYVGLVNDVAVTIDAKITESTDEAGESTDTISTKIKSITGNTNVGGYVGNAFVTGNGKYVEITNIGNVTINIYTKDYEYGTVDETEVFYMPTSVGGIVGSAKNVHISNVAMTKDTISISEDKDNTEKLPSNVGNYILKTQKTATFKFDPEEDYQEFDDMTTGVGGLIGTLDGYDAGAEEDVGVKLEDIAIASNVVVENGINVGGLVGYLKYSKTLFDTLKGISVGSLDSKNPVFVAGALGVGGMFGKINNGTDDIIASYDSFGNKTTIEINFGYLNIQAKEEKSGTATQMDIPTTQAISGGTTIENDGASGSESGSSTTTITPVHGEYVGAFVGVSTSIYEIKLDTKLDLNDKQACKVTIYNDEGGYYGGIVGKLNGSLGGIVTDGSASDVCNSSVNNTNINFHAESIYNYGGLVGLADATDNDVTILGSHGKAFTVDSVRVSADTDDADIHIDNNEKQILFYAHKNIAHNVTISKTRKYGLRGDMENYSGDNAMERYADYWNGLSNPITGTSSGWDAEYTMFRTMELTETVETSSSFSNNNGRSVTSTIYDANNIMKVVHSTTDGKILYTIYNNNDYPILYSRLGVATVLVTETGLSAANMDLKSYQASQYGYENFDTMSHSVNCNVLKPESLRYISSDDAKNDKSLKETGQDGGAFYNFESEKALQQLLQDESIDWEKIKNNFRLDFYYINVGGTYYKFDIIFADSTQNEYVIKGNNSKNGIATGAWDPRLKSADRTYSLFDVVDKTNHQVKVETEVKDYTWVVVVSTLLGGWIGAITSLIIIYSTGNGAFGMYGWSAKSIWFTVLMGTGGIFAAAIFGILGAIFGCFTKAQNNQNVALTYITSNYTGEYGLVSPDMVQPWYFSNGSLVCESDDSIVVTINITSGTIAADDRTGDDIKQIMYLYSSTSRPAQYGNVITIEEEVTSESTTTGLPEKDDKMPQYVYKNGKYYICMYGLSTSKRYVTTGSNLTLPGNVNWWYQNEDCSTYVASVLATAFNGEANATSKELFETEFGIKINNIVTSKSETKALHFGKLIGKDEDGKLNLTGVNGYDYYQTTFDDICNMSGWELSDSSGEICFTVYKGRVNLKDLSSNHNDAFFETNKYYLNITTAQDILSNSSGDGYETYREIVEKDVYNQYVNYKKNNVADESWSVLTKYIKFTGNGEDTLADVFGKYIGEDAFDKHIGEDSNVCENWKASYKYKYNKAYADGNGKLYLAASTYGIEQNATYYFYNAGLGETLSYASSTSSNGANTTYPIRETSSNPVLYKQDGTTKFLKDITTQAELKNYYIQPVYEDDTYKATNYYYIETKTIKSDTGDDYTYATYYEYDTSYILENVGTDGNPSYALTKVSVVDKNGNYIENKFALKVNGVTVWTHYKFNGTGLDFTVLSKNKNGDDVINLLPTSTTSGYVGGNEFYFNEVILFSGRTYTSGDNSKFKGGISMYNQKSSSAE